MIFIPVWITNLLLLLSCGLAGYQHAQLNRANPFATLQFGIMVFSLVMIVTAVVLTRSHHDPWLSLLFFLIAATTLGVTVRQFRTLPPRTTFE